MKPIKLRVYGLPAPQGSKKVVNYVDGRAILGESSGRVKPWRQDVRQAALEAKCEPFNVAVMVEAEFLYPRPKGHFGTGRNAGTIKASAPEWVTSMLAGDVDKVLRSTLDGLSAACGGTVIRDDSLVVEVHATKRYCDVDEPAGAWLMIRPASPES